MRLETKRHDLPAILKAATAYFALVFGAGFILGPIRILFIVPRFGVRIAELMEAPVMLIVIVVAARSVVRKVHSEHRLAIGVFALGLMIAFEFTLVLWLRGLTLAEYFRERDPVAATVYYLLLIVFAFMPFLVSARNSVSELHNEARKAG
jgi:type IV secretory pathway TrbD component